MAPCVPTGFAAGRIGNFINGELWGRFSSADLPWGMVFPQSGSPLPRHPSQLYQFALEGLLLFAVLWIYGKKPRGLGQVSGAFLAGYGVLRFIAEFFREPDNFLGLLALGMSMGQWLCVPMIVAGIALWAWGRGRAPGDASGLPPRAAPRPEETAAMRRVFPRYRNHRRSSPESGDQVIGDRLRRARQPAPHRPQPPLLSQPRAAQPQDAIAVHGLSEEFLADKPLFARSPTSCSST